MNASLPALGIGQAHLPAGLRSKRSNGRRELIPRWAFRETRKMMSSRLTGAGADEGAPHLSSSARGLRMTMLLASIKASEIGEVSTVFR